MHAYIYTHTYTCMCTYADTDMNGICVHVASFMGMLGTYNIHTRKFVDVYTICVQIYR